MGSRVVGGRYQLLSRLGRGGMGDVYEAADLASDRVVALKQLAIEDADDDARLRFQREFHTLASLEHPRIVRVHDYGVDETGPFYTMEILEGTDLATLILQRKRLLPGEACRILRDVASALTLLHARGLVHRDLSPRNVRVVENRGVLIDFGVLVPAGFVGDVAGTPAFVAPETLRGRPIDGRTDLYALGVLAYAMLTGEVPYPARGLRDLERAWREPPRPPSSYAPIPRALEEVILDLLRHEPAGRPASAAILVDRLTAAAGLDPDPELSVQPGYAPTAALVGRTRELRSIDRILEDSARGTPKALVVEADAGMGKSRLLGEIGIRSKLRGARVLQITCTTGERPFDALADVLDVAFHVAPEQAYAATERYAPVLCRLFPAIRDRFPLVDPAPRVPDPIEARAHMQETIAAVVRRLARSQPVAIIVDDVQSCDEASASIFLGLVNAAIPNSFFAFGLLSGDVARTQVGAVSAIANLDSRVVLGGLSVHAVAELLRSLFGDVPHIKQLAAGVHAATGGNPLWCTEIARFLVEEGIARYDDGSWVIPPQTALDRLPPELNDAMAHRIERLPGPTREVAEILALHDDALSFQRCEELVARVSGPAAHDIRSRTFDALDELREHGVMVQQDELVRFRHESVRVALVTAIPEVRRRALHRALAEAALEQGAVDDAGERAAVGWHLLYAGDPKRGAHYLELAGRELFEAQALRDCIPPLEAAMRVAEETHAPDHRRAELGFMLLCAGWVSHRELAWHYAQPTLALLANACGVSLARKLSFLGPHLGLAIGACVATMRWMVRRRGPNPMVAMTRYLTALGYACALAYTANHKLVLDELIRDAAPVRAFRGTTPFAAYQIVGVMAAIVRGHLGRAQELIDDALRLLRQKHLNPVGEDDIRLAEAGVLALRTLISLNEFERDDLDADVQRLRELELHYYDLIADTCEVVQLRLAGREREARELEPTIRGRASALSAWAVDLKLVLFAQFAYATCHDTEGLKRSLDRLRSFRDRGMAFDDRIALAHGELLRERGEFHRSSELLERCFIALDEDDALMRQMVAAALAESVLEMRELAAAKRWANAGIRVGDDESRRVWPARLRCLRVAALVELAKGRSDEAREMLDEALEVAVELHHPPLVAALHQALALVAHSNDDRRAFDHHLNQMDRWVRPTRNPSLMLMVERLAERWTDSSSQRRRLDGTPM